MKLNERGEIIDPNVGDAELVRMEFDSRWIDLHVKLALPEEIFVLRLVTPRWMSFATDCPQNVIDRVIVTTDLKAAAALAPPTYSGNAVDTRTNNLRADGQDATIESDTRHANRRAGTDMHCRRRNRCPCE